MISAAIWRVDFYAGSRSAHRKRLKMFVATCHFSFSAISKSMAFSMLWIVSGSSWDKFLRSRSANRAKTPISSSAQTSPEIALGRISKNQTISRIAAWAKRASDWRFLTRVDRHGVGPSLSSGREISVWCLFDVEKLVPLVYSCLFLLMFFACFYF